MTSNISRYALWIVLGYVLWINYQAWQKDYVAVDAAAAAVVAAHVPAGGLATEIPQSGSSSAPSSTAGTAAAVAAGSSAAAAPVAADSLAAAANVAAGPAVHIRTDLLDMTVSLTGGTISQADLNDYSLHKGQSQRVRLENHDSPETLYLLQIALSGPAGTDRPNQLATFTSTQTDYQMTPQQDELRVPLHWSDGHGVEVTKEFVFHRGSYAINVTQTVDNHSAAPWAASAYAQIVRNDPPTRSSLFSTNPERFASHGPAIWDTQYRKLKITDTDDKQLSELVSNGWIAAIQHQFVTAVVPPPNTDYRFTLTAQGDEYLLAASSATSVDIPAGGSASFPLTVFLGPKLQAQLATAGPNLQRVTDFGKLFVIAQPLFKALSWVHSVTGNWGVAILIVTLLLKLIFYPLSETSGKSMAKMRALQPRIKNIQEQYKDDKEKLSRATMELYQREKVNPVSGCLPMVVQIPVFFAFYWVLMESVEMRQAPFALWLNDLSARDPYFILPVLMAGAMFVQQRMNPTSPDPVQAKVMMFMPIAMSALFMFLPSGLVLYYVTNTALGVLQQWNINRRISVASARKTSAGAHMSEADTIVAAATPPGRGGIGIVRLSGPAAATIATGVLGTLPAARRAVFAAFRDAEHQTLDAGLVLYFPGPHSYTGEDVVEFHGHGGPIIVESLTARLVELGARRANPGEFTQRAFLNDKLDLAQAEAVADLIDAGSREAARAAMRSLQGEFSTMIQVLTGAVIELRTHVEAAIDFPEEEIDFLADPALGERLATVRKHFDAVTRSAGQGRLLRDGMTVVLAGAPNAGKSSLLNRLAGYDAAIVTAVPGTTRDVLRERIHVDGMPLHILDTAGLRAAQDLVEEEGIRRTQAEMARADRVLFVIDGAQDPTAQAYRELAGTLPAQIPVTLVYNKSDLTDPCAVAAPAGVPRIDVSALTGQGLDGLRAHLKSSMGYFTLESGSVSARQRHLEALARARSSVEEAARVLKETRAGELVAQELRSAQRALDEISGEFTNEDLLGPDLLQLLHRQVNSRWEQIRTHGDEPRTNLSAGATLIKADALIWLQHLPPNCIHAVVTDPPYGLIEYASRDHRKLRAGRGGVWRIPPQLDGVKRRPLPRFTVLSPAQRVELAEFFTHLGTALSRVLVPGAHVFVASNPLLSTLAFHALLQSGLEKRGEVVRLVQTLRGGDRPKGAETEFPGVSVMARSGWEPWGIFRKPLAGTVAENLNRWGTGGLRRVSGTAPFKDVILSAPTGRAERAIAAHPSLKPQGFVRQLVRASLPMGRGIVYDPFAGSGSTLAAAQAVGYQAVGTERDAQYYRMGCKAFARLAALSVKDRD